jgi:hypothetical protein
MPKLKALPKVRICVGFFNKGVVCRIFGNNHASPVIRENYVPKLRGEVLLRDAIKEFNLDINEVLFLR